MKRSRKSLSKTNKKDILLKNPYFKLGLAMSDNCDSVKDDYDKRIAEMIAKGGDESKFVEEFEKKIQDHLRPALDSLKDSIENLKSITDLIEKELNISS